MGKESINTWLTANKKKLLLFILLSLLIHLIFMLFFFRYDYHHTFLANLRRITDTLRAPTPDKKNDINKRKIDAKHEQICASLRELKKQKKLGLPAKLRAPKSNFGWVIFEEPPQHPQPEPLVIPTTLEGPVGHAAHAQATEGKEGTLQHKKLHVTQQLHKKVVATTPVTPPQKQPTTPQEIVPASQHVISQPVAQAECKEAQHPPSPTLLESPSHKVTVQAPPSTEKQSIEERIAHIRDLQEKLGAFQSGALPSTSSRATSQVVHAPEESTGAAMPQPREDRLIGGAGGIRIRGARNTTTQSKRNIIALTKGFIEKHYGEEGTDLIDRDGDPNKRPSFEELKYLSYESNINWCLQAAWKQNFSRRMMAHYPPRMEAVIEFTIDEHGTITQSTLLQSTGYTEIDSMIMENTKLASPFPPLPHHFGTKDYVTGRIIHVYADTSNF